MGEKGENAPQRHRERREELDQGKGVGRAMDGGRKHERGCEAWARRRPLAQSTPLAVNPQSVFGTTADAVTAATSTFARSPIANGRAPICRSGHNPTGSFCTSETHM